MKKTKIKGVQDDLQFIRNVNRLSKGGASQRANSRRYGTVTITESADMSKHGIRRFSVSGSKRLHNGGSYTMTSLRKAVLSRKRTKKA